MKSKGQLHAHLVALGLMDALTSTPISYATFKNRATIRRYGTKAKAVFVGIPQKNLFAFYTVLDSDTETMKEAYDMFKGLVKGDMTFYKDGRVQWGSTDIPTEYTDLSTK